MADLLVEPSL
jgi:hypothetical protein